MGLQRLVDRRPEVSAEELVRALTPPPRFDAARFSTYVPNPSEPSQAAAVEACREFLGRLGSSRPRQAGMFSRLFSRSDSGRRRAAGQHVGTHGLYLDGGFGVGKTHLLASLWHEAPEPKAYGTFVEFTHLIGVLGFAEAVAQLSRYRLLAIDEFELDDPGDTMLMTRFLAELTGAGVYVAATSNTLPDKLGEGRFAAVDFLREIHAMAARFSVVRVDGPDYRQRDLPEAAEPLSDVTLAESAEESGGTLDDFADVCSFLAEVHPSKYGRVVAELPAVHFRGVAPVADQSIALRLVALVDRLYDRAVPVRVSGQPVSALFSEEFLTGGYRKKYLRALSRLASLSAEENTARCFPIRNA